MSVAVSGLSNDLWNLKALTTRYSQLGLLLYLVVCLTKSLSLSGCHGDILNFTALSSITAYKPERISLEFDEFDAAGQKESLPLKGLAFTAASALLLFTIMCFHKKPLQLPNGILHFVTPYTRS